MQAHMRCAATMLHASRLESTHTQHPARLECQLELLCAERHVPLVPRPGTKCSRRNTRPDTVRILTCSEKGWIHRRKFKRRGSECLPPPAGEPQHGTELGEVDQEGGPRHCDRLLRHHPREDAVRDADFLWQGAPEKCSHPSMMPIF